MASRVRPIRGVFRLDTEWLIKGEWPWQEGVRARLPEAYRRHLMDVHSRQPIPVHYRPDERKYYLDKYGTRIRVQNVPIPIKFPREADSGLWGGEGFVVGLRKRKNNPMKPRTPEIWRPRLTSAVFYSEILDKWMAIVVTPRTLNLIDEAHGFDNYILKTHQVDLCSKLGMRLKREMLMALAKKSLYPNDPERREAVYEKYKDFIIPEEEIEWLGLSLDEAEDLQLRKEAEERFNNKRPLKEVFCEKLIQDLKATDEEVEQSSSLLKRLNPFKDSQT